MVIIAGMLWGVAVALLESVLLNRWFHVELQRATSLVELSLNYAIYAGLAALALRIVLRFAARRKGDGRSAGAGFDTGKMTEAVVASALVAAAIANFLQFGPLHHPLRSPATAGLALGALAVAVVLTWTLYRLRATHRMILRAGLALWVLLALVWTPLFAPYTGALRSPADTAAPGTYRNILLILTDTLRADFLGCYGGQWHASPAADRLAADGVLFQNHIAQSTWTLPSTASLLTSRYPSSHGAVAPAHPIAEGAETLTEVLARAGYRTAAFTENFHILPRNGFGRGFDSFWAIWLPWVFDDAVLYRVAAKLHLPTIELTDKNRFPDAVTNPEQVNWDARATTDEALEWLDDSGDAPFFAYIHYMGPHGPYGPREYLLDREPPAVAVTDHPQDMGGALPLGPKGKPVTAQAMADMKTLYAADILYVEREIERILDWVRSTGRSEETLVIFTSDHGEEFYDHGAWNHGSSAFQEVLRVPFIIRAPGLAKAGLRIAESTTHIDVMPTVLDLAGIDGPERVQGRSLRPLLEGRELAAVPAYTEVFPVRPPNCTIVSLVKEHYKLIQVELDGNTASMLYDLEADPLELDDIYERDVPRGDSLAVELALWDAVAGEYGAESRAVPLDSRQIEALRALGYIK